MHSRTDDEQSSLTALGVLSTFIRALETKYGYLLTDNVVERRDLEVAKRILNAVRYKPMNFFSKIMSTTLYFPYSIQKSIFSAITHKDDFDDFILQRKLLIKNKIESAIANGVDDVIVLGGGYDPRAFLEAIQNSTTRFFEIERGKTFGNKANILKTLSADMKINFESNREGEIFNKNFCLINFDIADGKLPEILSRYQGTKKLVIAEGWSMYQRESDISKILDSLYALLGENDEFLVSFASTAATPASLKRVLAISSEEAKFALPPDQVIPFVAKHGFDVVGKSFDQYYDPNKLEEFYYVLRRSSDVINASLNKKMNDVPMLDFAIPTSREKTAQHNISERLRI